MQSLLYGAPKLREPLIGQPGFVEVPHRAFQIIGVPARTALSFRDEPHLLIESEPSGILLMFPVDDETQRIDRAPATNEFHPLHDVSIDKRHLLARLQISLRLLRAGGIHAERNTTAGAACIEAEHETRLFGRSPVNMAVDTE